MTSKKKDYFFFIMFKFFFLNAIKIKLKNAVKDVNVTRFKKMLSGWIFLIYLQIFIFLLSFVNNSFESRINGEIQN